MSQKTSYSPLRSLGWAFPAPGEEYTWNVPRLPSILPSPVEGLRPTLAGGPAYVVAEDIAAAAFTIGVCELLDVGLAVLSRIALAMSGVSDGFCWNMSAAMPATTAVACEVPVPLKYDVPTTAEEWNMSTVESGSRSETMLMPGASRSGLANLSGVGPRLEKSASTTGLPAFWSWTFAAPTVSTKGSSPGLSTVPGDGPRFPAATTTNTPESHTCSTA